LPDNPIPPHLAFDDVLDKTGHVGE